MQDSSASASQFSVRVANARPQPLEDGLYILNRRGRTPVAPSGNAVKDFNARKVCQYKPDAQASEFFERCGHTRLRVGLVFCREKILHGVALQGFRCWALYFTWDLHPRLVPAVPIGTKNKTVNYAERLMPGGAASLAHFAYKCA